MMTGEQLARIDGLLRTKQFLSCFCLISFYFCVKLINIPISFKRGFSIKWLWNLSLYHLTLSGLDPAAPLYDMDSGLNASCAKFVQVIHTSKYFGTQKRLGHSDFYANKGKSKQPGCLLDTCNHSRATELFYASCFQEYIFMGTNCNGTSEQSRFGLYNDGKEGCFQFDTSGCFGYADTNYNFFTYI